MVREDQRAWLPDAECAKRTGIAALLRFATFQALENLDLLSLQAFGALDYIELHLLTLLQ